VVERLVSGLIAQAAAPEAAPGGWMVQLLPILLIFGVFYFLLLRPQQKQAQKHREYLTSLRKGDEVVTQSGIFGRIDSIEDTVVRLEIARDVKIRILKSQIAAAQPGSAPAAESSPAGASNKV
jgi:preprotein translocase subunit YajC